MADFRSASFCLIVCFLVCSSEGQKIISADLGQDVILPCKVPNKNISNIRAVEWIRPDQDPEYVLVYRNGQLDLNNQHPSYQNRVDLQDKDMKDGDASMILKNVKMEDKGRYECRIFEKGKYKLISIILEVHPPAEKIKKAEVGQDVILPCKIPNNKTIIVVEWIRPDQDPDHVLFYRDGRIDPVNQYPFYQNRVDLQDKDMKDGDASLILMNVTRKDTGRYVCRVFQKGSNRNKRSNLNNDPINIISLQIRLSGDSSRGRPGVVGGILSLLPVVLASVGFLMYKRPIKKNPNLPVPFDEAAAGQMSTFPEQQQNKPQLV